MKMESVATEPLLKKTNNEIESSNRNAGVPKMYNPVISFAYSSDVTEME